MADRWLRWYDGTIRDGKMRIVAELLDETVATVIGIWASVLEDASVNEPRGKASKGKKWHALYLQIGEERIGTAWNAFEQVGMVKVTGDVVSIINWDKRQFETDAKDPTAKTRKDKWKQRVVEEKTVRNGLERSGTPETETETETETEKNKDYPLRGDTSPTVSRETPRAKRKPTKIPLPETWTPSPAHFAAASRLKLSTEAVEGKAEDMRIWAQSNDIRKANWDATFHGFLRTAANKSGVGNGFGGPRPLQDDAKSISAAAGRLAEKAERGEFTFGPRPSLLPENDPDVVLLLPQGRSARS